MAETIKIRKKDIQEAKRPDVVLSHASSLFDWLVERKALALGLLGAVVAAGLIIAAVDNSRRKSREETGAQLASAVELSTRPVIEGQSNDKSFGSAEEKTQKSVAAFEALARDASGPAAQAARFKLAQLRLESGDFDGAVSGFDEYLGNRGADLRVFALEGLGYAHEGKGDLARAREAFARLGDAGARDRALYHEGRLFEREGDKVKARESYQRLVSEFESAAVATEARARLDLLNAPPPGTGALEPVAAEPPAPAKTERTAATRRK